MRSTFAMPTSGSPAMVSSWEMRLGSENALPTACVALGSREMETMCRWKW